MIGRPKKATVTNISSTNNSIKFKWTSNVTTANIDVYIGANLIKRVKATTSNVTISSLLPNTNYTIKLKPFVTIYNEQRIPNEVLATEVIFTQKTSVSRGGTVKKRKSILKKNRTKKLN